MPAFELTVPHAALLIVLGAVVGACGTLIGAGGGFMLVPLLLLLDPSLDPRTITAISLAVVCANALSGSIAYGRLGRIDYAAGGVFALATLPGAVLGAVAIAHVTRGGFSAVFGVALIGLALASLRRATPPSAPPTPHPSWWERRLVERSGEAHEYRFDVRIGIALSVAVGFIASLLGIGGGVVHVPALVLLLGFPVHIATATSHFTLVFTALAATLVHVLRGDLSGPTIAIQVLLLVAGVIPGAQLGARWAKRVQGTWVMRLLAGALALIGVRLIVLGLGA